jgi:protocatechuate 3,4-dioxygenase, beta subunit
MTDIRIRASRLPLALALATIVATVGSTAPQVDQDWLREWREVQADRPATPGSTARIAPAGEPGTPLVIHGRVFQPDGKTPAPNVVVFAYHTDRDGLYVPPGRPRATWRLRGWARTDGEGRFEFRTIRPGVYPSRSESAHVHVTLESPDYGRQWTSSLRFADDALVDVSERRQSASAGRFGPVRDVTMRDGVAYVDFFVRLKTKADF